MNAFQMGFKAGFEKASVVEGGRLIATTGERKGQPLSKAKKSPKEIMKQEYAILKSKQRRGEIGKKDVESGMEETASQAY